MTRATASAGTAVALPGNVLHGTGNAYSNYGCRCEQCRENRGARSREYRKRNGDRFLQQRRDEYAKNPERFKRLTQARLSRMKALVERYKMLVGCVRCGYKEHPGALQLHHRDPATKLFNVSEQLGRAKRVVLSEIRKCDVLCANCHGIEHYRRAA